MKRRQMAQAVGELGRAILALLRPTNWLKLARKAWDWLDLRELGRAILALLLPTNWLKLARKAWDWLDVRALAQDWQQAIRAAFSPAQWRRLPAEWNEQQQS